MKKGKLFLKLFILFTIFVVVSAATVLSINGYVKKSMSKKILSISDATSVGDYDCIIVLGAGVWNDETPGNMLKDRLVQAIKLYEGKAAPKLLMSGDHGRTHYDEVNVMKKYATLHNVPSEDIFMDHAGFSTYETMYRAKEIFKAKKVLIVTQKYHLYRSLYIANALGLEAYGVESLPNSYYGQDYRDLREILAINKDFWKTIFKPKPTFLGEAIPVSGNGDVTNDKSN